MKTKKILFVLSLVFCSLGSLLCRGIDASAQGSLKSKGVINVSENVKFDKTDLELIEGNNKSNNTDINTLKSDFNNLILEVSSGKSLIAKAITDQGELVDAKASFQELADKVNVMAGTQYQAGLAEGGVKGKQDAVNLLFPKLNSINELINTQLATNLSTSYSASSTLSEIVSGIESSKIKLNESLNKIDNFLAPTCTTVVPSIQSNCGVASITSTYDVKAINTLKITSCGVSMYITSNSILLKHYFNHNEQFLILDCSLYDTITIAATSSQGYDIKSGYYSVLILQ